MVFNVFFFPTHARPPCPSVSEVCSFHLQIYSFACPTSLDTTSQATHWYQGLELGRTNQHSSHSPHTFFQLVASLSPISIHTPPDTLISQSQILFHTLYPLEFCLTRRPFTYAPVFFWKSLFFSFPACSNMLVLHRVWTPSLCLIRIATV